MQSYPRGISPDGTIIGQTSPKYSGTTNVGGRGMVWQNGTLSEVPTLGTNSTGSGYSNLRGITNSNLVFGDSGKYDSVTHASRGQRAITWQNGTLSELPTLGTDSTGYGSAFTWAAHPVTNVIIGDSDKMVGDDYFGSRAVTWQNGAITELPILGTDVNGSGSSDAGGINAAGAVVGYSEYYDGTGAYKGFHAVKWQNGGVADLGTFGVSSSGLGKSNAFGINDAGVIIGNSQKYVAGVDKGLRGAMWTNGQMYEMGTLGADSTGKGYSNYWRQNLSDQAVGTTKKYDGSGNYLGDRATFFEPVTGTTFIAPSSDLTGYGFSQPQFITDDGLVFGDYYKFNISGNYLGTYAFMWSKAGGEVDLDSLIAGGPAAAGWDHLEFVEATNSLGQLVGYGIRSNGETQGFVLTPTPEPATIGLLAPAVLLFLRRRRT